MSLSHGAIIRGDSTRKKIALVFSGHEFADGGNYIQKTLKRSGIRASFFFTGKFYRNPAFRKLILQLHKDGHYLGPHSNDHLLYCDWTRRDSLLVNKQDFLADLRKNDSAMKLTGLKGMGSYFLPPYEWYNDTIASWTKEAGMQLVNFTPGTLSNADYTTPLDRNYRTSEKIFSSITDFEKKYPGGLNGFMLLMHIGTDARRTDKFYKQLPQLIQFLKQKGYEIVTVEGLLN